MNKTFFFGKTKLNALRNNSPQFKKIIIMKTKTLRATCTGIYIHRNFKLLKTKI